MNGRTILLLCLASALLGVAVPVIARSLDHLDLRMRLLRIVNRGAFRPDEFAK